MAICDDRAEARLELLHEQAGIDALRGEHGSGCGGWAIWRKELETESHKRGPSHGRDRFSIVDELFAALHDVSCRIFSCGGLRCNPIKGGP